MLQHCKTPPPVMFPCCTAGLPPVLLFSVALLHACIALPSCCPAAADSKAVMASAPTLAMGRGVGSLTVLTAKDEDAASAMLASWVSQVGAVSQQTIRSAHCFQSLFCAQLLIALPAFGTLPPYLPSLIRNPLPCRPASTLLACML